MLSSDDGAWRLGGDWTAAGRKIARLRIYFDGRHGGQETTFGQDAINDDAANDRARRDDDLPE